ncbi:MAG: hypothetical protein DRN09_04310, partial [Thermoplasmata archaeon]
MGCEFMESREDKLKVIHDAIDSLFTQRALDSSVAFEDTTENIVDRVERVVSQMENENPQFPFTVETPGFNQRLFPVPKPEPAFLIFEGSNNIEELLLNPSIKSDKIEEIILPALEEKTAQTRMVKTSTKPSPIPIPKHKIDVGVKRQEEIVIDERNEKREIVDEKKGFGWKGLGSAAIVFDKRVKEYRYVVREPKLSGEEIKLKNDLTELFKLLADVPVFDADEEKRRDALIESLEQIIRDNKIKVSDESKDRIFYYLVRDFVGYGRIDILMKDEDIEDISCDGSAVPVFVYHRKYQSIESNVKFKDSKELDSFVVRLAQICGKQISIYAPIVDGKLPDGSRLQATLSKTVTNESTFTIRRFREDPLTPIDLIENNTMSVEMAAYFWLAIENGASILFCGGTASGKTSTLNALSLFIPFSHKIVSIEDTREVNLPHKNWIAGTTREGFSSAESEKTGKDIDMFDLIRAGLRQRPRVIIVGEVRGREAYSLFQAMATGHTSYATVHASSIHALIQRLENPPISLPRALLTSLDIIVFINAIPMGKKMVRRITSVTEIIKMDPDTRQLIFMQPFTWVSKVDDRFESSGTSKILTNIRMANEWTEEQLQKEIDNRIKVLNWMRKHRIRNYQEVGAIISAYYKDSDEVLRDPSKVLKKMKEEK